MDLFEKRVKRVSVYQYFAYVYDRLMEDMPYPEWQQFLQQCFVKYGTPRTIVDLGCGTGNIAIPLAQSGFDVTGIDLSGDMLAAAQAKLKGLRLGERGAIRWIEQDMAEWELPQPVDCAISFCDSLNYLTEERRIRQVFARTYRGLANGGLFVFDMHTIYQLENYALGNPFYLDEEEIAYIWTCDWDEEHSEIEHRLTFFVDEGLLRSGEEETALQRFIRIEESHKQRAYETIQVREWLKQAGFDVLGVFSDFLWKPLDDHTERAFFVAVKPH